jgi:hypothetical protein
MMKSLNSLLHRRLFPLTRRIARHPILLTLGLLLLRTPLCMAQPAGSAQDLAPLPYNNPGLVVDLGVGLWAWPIPADVDGDGDYDLLVSCHDKPSNGVWLFENVTGDTANNKFPVFAPARHLGSTVQYVMPSYVDGHTRVLSPGWEYPAFLNAGLAERVPLPVDPKFYQPDGPQRVGPGLRHNQWRYADFDGDGALDLIVGIEDWSHYGWDNGWTEQGTWENGPLHGFIFVFVNRGTSTNPDYAPPFKLTTLDGAVVNVYGCPSPNFADFDGDGDLDLLCGEFLDGFTYFENVGTRTHPRYASGRRLKDARGEVVRMDLQMIVPVAFDWDRDGDQDLIVGDEDGRVALVEHSGEVRDGLPIFKQPVYFQQLADTLKCGALATPVGVDWDGDGDWDILSGNTAGYIEFFENLSGPGVAEPSWAAPVRLQAGGETFRVMAGPTGSIQGPAEAKWGYTTFSVADWNHDSRLDIIFNSIWGRVQWLENLAAPGEPPRFAAPQDLEVAWTAAPPGKVLPGNAPPGKALPGHATPAYPNWLWWRPDNPHALVTQWRTTPVAIDWTGDGLCDLVMLDHEGYLSLYQRQLLDEGGRLSPPQRIFRSVGDAGVAELLQLNAGESGRSGRRKLCIVDWDGDGLLDVLVNSQNADWLRQISTGDTSTALLQSQGAMSPRSVQGHTTSPTVVDFDGDGRPELLVGAEDGRLYYLSR